MVPSELIIDEKHYNNINGKLQLNVLIKIQCSKRVKATWVRLWFMIKIWDWKPVSKYSRTIGCFQISSETTKQMHEIWDWFKISVFSFPTVKTGNQRHFNTTHKAVINNEYLVKVIQTITKKLRPFIIACLIQPSLNRKNLILHQKFN